jgi:hypothetical protein
MRDHEHNEYTQLPLAHLEFLAHLVLVLQEKDRSDNSKLKKEANLINAEIKWRERHTKVLLSQLP